MSGESVPTENWGGVDPLAADRLAQRHFTLQYAQAAELSSLEVGALDPLLRCLLFTDGTVTRALEAQTLCSVAVDVVDQSRASLPAWAANHLDASADAECIRRRVAMTIMGPTPAVWAESYLLADRLPAGFLGLLDSMPHGIGGSLEQARLESRRELLWFRLSAPPPWAGPVPSSVSALVRLYRIITNSRPALLISEAFAVEGDGAMYRPLGCAADSAEGSGSVAGSQPGD
jgi:chorismate-pyruvate lyase